MGSLFHELIIINLFFNTHRWLAATCQLVQNTIFSPSTILRCLNRVVLSFLTSWILSVDFLTSTWSFLLNMIQCEPPAAAGTATIIDDTAQDGPHRCWTSHLYAITTLVIRKACSLLSRRIGVEFPTHLRSDVRDGHLESLTGSTAH